MPKVVLVAGRAYQIPLIEHADYYGVDHGAICCMHQQIKMKKAIGDFDSITFDELEELKKNTKVIQLPTHKDETDSEAAILIAMEDGYDEIILFGGLGGRIDHEMVNLHLMLYRDYPLTLMDENNTVKVLSKGTYEVEKTHRYLSFLPLEESCITEEGVAYPLDKRKLSLLDIYTTSNEIVNEKARIIIHYGKVLMMQCNDVKENIL